MKKINWKYKNIYAFSDGTGMIEEEINNKLHTVDFNWSIICWDDYYDRMNVSVELSDIDVYDFKENVNTIIKIDEYKEELEEFIEQYINENSDRFGIDTLEDLKNYLNND
jgi:tRNA splicing ligase